MNVKKLVVLLLVCVLSFNCVACGTTQSSSLGEEPSSKPEKPVVTEKIYVDNENCTFKIVGVEEDNIWGYTLKAELENKTDVNLMFSFEDVSVNGYMCDPFWATSVQAGKKAKSDISFSDTSFEELEIEEVETIEFTLSVYDEDDWLAPRYVEEKFTYTINE